MFIASCVRAITLNFLYRAKSKANLYTMIAKQIQFCFQTSSKNTMRSFRNFRSFSLNSKTKIRSFTTKMSVDDMCAHQVVTKAKKNNPNSVIQVIDEFVSNGHRMMNLGQQKGAIVDKVLEKVKPKLLLELGTYCGYSATRFFTKLPLDSTIISVDPQPREAALKILKHAGVFNRIRLVEGKACDILPLLKHELGAESIDAVFIDHAKPAYLNDLKLLEQTQLLAPGSVVISDNVLEFAILKDYLKYIDESKSFSDHKVYSFELEKGNEKIKDGLSIAYYNRQ